MPKGLVVAIDIEPKMIERVKRRIQAEGVTNVEARLANVYDLPFEDASFDLIYLITVIGEIPQPPRAFSEFRRVLKPNGKLVFSELLMDPDYPLASRLTSWVEEVGFSCDKKLGNFFYYTLVFKVDSNR